MRIDITNELCHWIKAKTDDDAIDILCNIMRQRKVVGSNGFVKGAYDCVCFTESPYLEFHKQKHRYKKYGILVKKNWAFGKGGRPVIYQTEEEFHLLPDELKWRHVTYNPPSVDFTWEREWRINSSEIEVVPEDFLFLVPFAEIGECLSTQYITEQHRLCCGALEENDDYGKNWIPKPFRYRVIGN